MMDEKDIEISNLRGRVKLLEERLGVRPGHPDALQLAGKRLEGAMHNIEAWQIFVFEHITAIVESLGYTISQAGALDGETLEIAERIISEKNAARRAWEIKKQNDVRAVQYAYLQNNLEEAMAYNPDPFTEEP